jgi:2-aminoethylphosphonate dioxygenase
VQAAQLALRTIPAFEVPSADRGPDVYRPREQPLRYGLSSAQLAAFVENGYVILRKVFSTEEVNAWQAAADELLRRADIIQPHNLRLQLKKSSEEVWKIDPFLELHGTFCALARDRRLLDPLASIFGQRQPVLFKDKLIYKPPQGEGNALHQDYNWWQGFPTSLISVLVALDPADRENGCTQLFSGYQRGLLTPPGTIGNLNAAQVAGERSEYVETQPGDIALFHCMAPHCAGPNRSSRWRKQIFLTYNDSADGEHYFAHREHYLWYRTRALPEESRSKASFK